MAVTPTGSGWTAVGTAGTAVAIGTAFDYPEIVAIGLCAAALMLAALAWTCLRPGVRADRHVRPARVEQGVPVTCELTVWNRSRRRTAALEVTETVAGEPLRFILDAVPGRSSGQVHRYDLPTDRRGVYELPPPSVDMFDPARMIVRRFTPDRHTTFYVYPRHDVLWSFGAGDRRDADGLASSPRANGIAFYALREYVPGDDSRLIHWPSTARTGTLMVRHNSVPDAPGYLVVLDTRANCYEGSGFEEAVRVAASLCVSAVLDGARLYLRTTGGRHMASTADAAAQTTTALDFLAGVDMAEHQVAWPVALACESDVHGIALITGAVGDDQLIAVARASSPDTAVMVIRLDGKVDVGRVNTPLPVVTAPTGARFATYWNTGR